MNEDGIRRVVNDLYPPLHHFASLRFFAPLR